MSEPLCGYTVEEHLVQVGQRRPPRVEMLLTHIELDHDVPVERAGETAEQALERVKRLNPRIGGPGCRCPECAWAVGLAKTAGA